jgi:hypothetical protein
VNNWKWTSIAELVKKEAFLAALRAFISTLTTEY